MRKNPVFLYAEDNFQKPSPFEPDVVVPIDSVFDKKLATIDALESQLYEWNPWLFGYLDKVPKGKAERPTWTRSRAESRWGRIAGKYRANLVDLPAKEAGNAVKHAEAFEVREYGSQPNKEDRERLFPFFGKEK